jgi:hypothetical protein
VNLGHDEVERLEFNTDERGQPVEVHVQAQSVLALSSRAIDHIEALRAKHRKGDVVLSCEAQAHFLVRRVVNAPLRPGPQLKDEHGKALGTAVVYDPSGGGEAFRSEPSHMWVLSGGGGQAFMERFTMKSELDVVIHSSDWVHDYSAPWKATKYMVVELPQAEMLSSIPGIDERVNAAIEAAKRASDNVTKGEWSNAVEDLRPVWELLRNQADIQGLLQRDGYPQDAIAALNESIRQQFEFVSKFLHRSDKTGKKVAPEVKASKEDAWLCFSFAASLLNLVSRKAQRLR